MSKEVMAALLFMFGLPCLCLIVIVIEKVKQFFRRKRP